MSGKGFQIEEYKNRFPAKLFIGIGIISSLNLGTITARMLGGGLQSNIIVVLVLIWISIHHFFSGRRLRVSFDHFLLAIFFVAFLLVSFIQEPEVSRISYEAFQLYWKLFLFCFIFPITLSTFKVNEIQLVCVGIIYGLIPNFLVGLLQVIGLSSFASKLTNSSGSELQSARAAGFWGDPNETACLVCIVYVIMGAVKFRGRVPVLWSAVCISFVVITSSRTGFLAILIILVYNAVSQPFKSGGQILISLLKICGAPIFLWIFIVLGGRNDLLEKFYSVGDSEMRDVSEGGSSLSRMNLFMMALESVLDQDPIFGVGAVKMSRIVPLGASGLGPHNLFLYIYGSAGIPAIILFITSFILLGYRMVRNLNKIWWPIFVVIFLGFISMHTLILSQHFALIFAIIFTLAIIPKRKFDKIKLDPVR